jgi:hypothetical protein
LPYSSFSIIDLQFGGEAVECCRKIAAEGDDEEAKKGWDGKILNCKVSK